MLKLLVHSNSICKATPCGPRALDNGLPDAFHMTIPLPFHTAHVFIKWWVMM